LEEIMARKVKSAKLDSREARRKLEIRGKPHWHSIERELHIGYRRLKGKAGTWVVRHYLGRQRYGTEAIGIADDVSDADGATILDFWMAQAKARERMTEHAKPANGALTVQGAVEQYLHWLESNRKGAYDARRRAEAFIYPKLGNVECDALTSDQLRKWHLAMSKEAPRLRTAEGEKQQYRDVDHDDESIRRRRASANRVLTILKAALNRAWREGDIASDAAWRRVEPFEAVDAARIRYLQVEEARRLINACDPEFRAVVQAALATGARYGELCRLEVQDFNPDAGTLAVRKSKSGKPRHVVLTGEGAALFKQLSAGHTGHEPMLRRTNGEAFAKSHQARPMNEACSRAKLKPRINFHGLRHTWASLSVMNGMQLLVIAKNLGHSDTRMVEKHYGHLAPSYVADQVREHAPTFGLAASNVATIR
jgi:integrase